jgi:hypothetical protein
LPGQSELIEDDLYRIPDAEKVCGLIATELDTCWRPSAPVAMKQPPA